MLGDSKDYISGYYFKLTCFRKSGVRELPEIKIWEFPKSVKLGEIQQKYASQ